MTKDQVLQIAALRQAGTRNSEICARLGLKLSTLHYWINRLRKAGTKIPKHKSPGRPKLDINSESMP